MSTVIDQPRLAVAQSQVRGANEVLTPAALDFVAELHERFDSRRRALLAARAERQKLFDAGELPDFLEETRDIREAEWTVAPIPRDLLDRRVEITGPTNAKMIINALNSGAKVFMAIRGCTSRCGTARPGQVNLRNRWLGKLDFTDPESGKRYAISDNPAVLMVRPRGWHLDERHVTFDGLPVAGGLFDLGLYLWHNARPALSAGSGPYFYLPKLESATGEMWNDVFAYAEKKMRSSAARSSDGPNRNLPAAFEWTRFSLHSGPTSSASIAADGTISFRTSSASGAPRIV